MWLSHKFNSHLVVNLHIWLNAQIDNDNDKKCSSGQSYKQGRLCITAVNR